LLGQMQLGAWRLDVNIAQVGAVLRAGKPLIETLANDRLQVRLPVTIMRGQGRATVRFRWNAAGIANVVCRDFNVTRRVDGMVMTDSYTLNGDFVLRSADGSILAEPHLNPQTLRVRVRPTKATRLAVRAALSEQNSLLKCGLAMDPDDVMAKLDALLAPGFPVEVPAIALPAVRIPASFRYSMEPRRAAALDLSIQNTALRLSPEYLWLHATIETHRAPALELSAPAGAGPAAQPSF
ncbi:MAG: hypothetical protein MUF51_06230, partial [Vicinamibacteria bacterium]|nr:hypothetical protein [Vicinamibacteria bacterium]